MADTQAASAEVRGAPVPACKGTWVERLQLTNFRNYASLVLRTAPRPVVLIGPNGSGKTNLLEAVSLLTSGQGLRRSPYPELARMGSSGWAVAAHLNALHGTFDIGTGQAQADGSRRIVRIDGVPQSGSGVLDDYVEMVWLTPAMDGLFTGPAGDRRRFLDRLIACFDPAHRSGLGRFERAMQQRNRLLADGVFDDARLEGFEQIMAEAGVAIAASRAVAVAELAAVIATRRERASSCFPWADLALAGTLEAGLARHPAIEVEDEYVGRLRTARERDRAAARALDGPHRSDLIVGHGPKELPAKVCSTGEQKALLIGLVLAHAELVGRRRDGLAPIMLLDEISAHLDQLRRAALFDEILALGGQAWMSGTDREAFAGLENRAQFYHIEDGRIGPPS